MASLGSPMGPYAFPESDFLDMQTHELPLPHTGPPQGLPAHSFHEAPSRPSRLGPLPRQAAGLVPPQRDAHPSLASVWLASPEKSLEQDPPTNPWQVHGT